MRSRLEHCAAKRTSRRPAFSPPSRAWRYWVRRRAEVGRQRPSKLDSADHTAAS